MTKKNVIIGIVVLLLIVGGWYVFSLRTASPSEHSGDVVETPIASSTPTTPTATKSSAPAKGTGTLKSAFSQGGNYTCSLTTVASNNGQTTGVIYAAGAKTRVDFQSKTATGAVSEVHIIRDGVSSYTWVAGQTTGIKTQITSSSSIVPHQPSGSGFSLDDNASISWDCHPWLTNSAQFVPPTNVTFIAG